MPSLNESGPVIDVSSLAHHDVLAGDVVRPGEVDPLLALVVDRVGRRRRCRRCLFDHVLADRGRGLPYSILSAGMPSSVAMILRDLDVEARRLAVEALQAEARLVELGADVIFWRLVQPLHGACRRRRYGLLAGRTGALVGRCPLPQARHCRASGRRQRRPPRCA